MAIHAHSTTAPTVQPRLLPFTFRPVPAQLSGDSGTLPARTADELLGEIAYELERQSGVVSPNDPPERPPLLPSPAPLPSLSAALSRRRAIFGAVALDEPDTAAEARALHFRREMHQALDWGFALLDALDLPPLALDVIDDAIATLDALDAPDEDREPWLAGVVDLAFVDGAPALDAENDSEEDEGTALESHGRGFVRAGEDDAEEDDEPERDDECGSDDGEDIGHHASQFRPVPLTLAERAEVAAIAARTALLRRPAHA